MVQPCTDILQVETYVSILTYLLYVKQPKLDLGVMLYVYIIKFKYIGVILNPIGWICLYKLQKQS